MKKLNVLLLSLCLLGVSTFSSFAGSNDDWQQLASINSLNQQTIFPRAYTPYYLNLASIKAQLSKASLNPESPIQLSLPNLNGGFTTYNVWESPVMAPELQAQFPDIRTYSAVDVNNPTVTAKLAYNNYGFRAVVFSPQENYFISPFSLTPDGYYLLYREKDKTGGGFAHGPCGVNESLTKGAPMNIGSTITNTPGSALRTNGNIRHYYRCAIACTGEWANQVTGGAPTISNVLSIISSVLNGANGVFERELSVHMVLIPEETQVIYLDPLTDPYTADGNNDQLIGENQTNFDVVFPTGAEYDIAHIFNTAGGGLAQLASICQMGGKASGVSSANNADDYSVIIHEMGHMMGSNHVFNSQMGGCGGNGVASTAYEPGSGSTIMCYNGVCGADNTQASPVDYYHVYSLDAIGQVISNTPNCGTDSMGYNPIVISDSDMVLNYNIPKNTPFELYAPEAVPSENNPSVTYCWEQYDLGHFEDPEAQSATWDAGPVLQSFPPTTNQLRTFPSMSVLLTGSYGVVGERLPNKERDMKFRLTARSFKNGWGTFNTNISPVNIHVANNQFRVTAPALTDAGAIWEVGSTHQITWDTGGSRQSPVNSGFVDIFISTDGGNTFTNQIVSSAPNNGSYNYVVDDIYSDSVRFKVKGHGNIYFDISKANISIHGNPHTGISHVDANNTIAVYPNPANTILSIDNSIIKHPLQVSLYNILGQRMWQGNMQQQLDINVKPYANGTYILYFYDTITTKRYSKKITIQH